MLKRTNYTRYSSYVQFDNIFVTSSSELKQKLYKCIGTDSATIYDKNGEKTISISEYFNEEFFLLKFEKSYKIFYNIY